MHQSSMPENAQMTPQAIQLLARAEDKAATAFVEDDLRSVLGYFFEEVRLEPDGPVKAEAATFVARFSDLVSAERIFVKLFDAVNDTLVLDAPSPAMLSSVREASEALRRAVAAARLDLQTMREMVRTRSCRLERDVGLLSGPAAMIPAAPISILPA